MAIGARPFLIAYNINLASDDVDLARRIARRVRESGGGLPKVQANGFEVHEPERGHPRRAQVSMNLLDFEVTPLWLVWDAVRELAAEDGVALAESELIGLAPLAAFLAVADHAGADPSDPIETRLAGRPTGEYGLNALALGAWGIPVGMVTGDDALAEEVAAWLPWTERVVVKSGDGTHSAISIHPSLARERIRDGAEAAVTAAAAGRLQTLRVEPPVVIEVDYGRGVVADHAAVVPGVERVGERTIRIEADDPILAYRGFLAANRLASAIDD